MKFVRHQLLHLPQNYRDFSTLYETSSFPHKSNLGTLKNMLYSKNLNFLDKEVCNKFALQICLNERFAGHTRGDGTRSTSKAQGIVFLNSSIVRYLEELV